MIWCVEDDASIRDIEQYALQSAGFHTVGFEDGASLWAALQKERPQLIILDVMLPQIDGIELLRRMKRTAGLQEIPVILATAKGSEYDRILGLDLGADDYLVKPFSIMEMTARVKAVLRRCRSAEKPAVLRYEGLILNRDAHTVTADSAKISLTHKEYELLRLFLSRPAMALTREQLFAQVWGTDYFADTRTLDMHIRTLRQKLGKYGTWIETIRNVGYRFDPNKK